MQVARFDRADLFKVRSVGVLIVLGVLVYILQTQMSARSEDYGKIGESAAEGAKEILEKIKTGQPLEETTGKVVAESGNP